jgi:hypothetical protein
MGDAAAVTALALLLMGAPAGPRPIIDGLWFLQDDRPVRCSERLDTSRRDLEPDRRGHGRDGCQRRAK